MRASVSSLSLVVSVFPYAVAAAAQEPAEAPAVSDGPGSAATETYTTFEKLSYNVEGPVRAVRDGGEVTVTLYHAYPSALHNVRMNGSSDVLDVSVVPAVVEKLKPTLFQSFTVHVSLKRPVETDRVVVPLTIRADEFAGEPTIEVTVPLTAAAERAVNEALALPVGEVEIRVQPHSNVAYYAYALATVGILVWLVVRKRRAA